MIPDFLVENSAKLPHNIVIISEWNDYKEKSMDESEKNELSRFLVEKGITPSYQRRMILKEIRGRNDHPSAELIFQSLSPQLPTLSRTTVDNTLGLFERRGLIQSFFVDGHEMRYDFDVTGSVHFFCEGCHAIIDPPKGTLPALPPDWFKGFELRQVQVIARGLCPSCLNKKNSVQLNNERRIQP